MHHLFKQKFQIRIKCQGEQTKDRNGTCAPGREPSKRKGSGPCEVPSPAGGVTGTERALPKQSAEPAAAGGQPKTGTDGQRRLCAPRPETHAHWCKQGLRAGARASKGQPGDRTGVGCAETAWRGWILVRLQPTGYAEEA